MAKFSKHIFPGATFDRQAFWSHIGYPVTSFGSLLANFRALTQSSKGHFVVVSKLYIPVNHAFLRSLVCVDCVAARDTTTGRDSV